MDYKNTTNIGCCFAIIELTRGSLSVQRRAKNDALILELDKQEHMQKQ